MSLAFDRNEIGIGQYAVSQQFHVPEVSSLRLPIASGSGVSESCVCYSWHYGDAPWINAFVPALKQWVARHQMELRVDRQSPLGDGLRECPYRQWIQDFLVSDFAWMLSIDADVMVHPLAPHILHESRDRGWWASGGVLPGNRSASWKNWVKQVELIEIPDDFVYANDGVWLLDRKTAEKLLPHTEGYVAGHVPLEYYFNLWRLRLHKEHPNCLKELPSIWNRQSSDCGVSDPAWFYHCAGKDKGRVWKRFQLQGLLPVPQPSMTFKPWPDQAEMEKLIALPFRLQGDVWQGEMLRYTLRSLDQYGPSGWPLIVWGDECPEWLDESVFRQEDLLPRKLLKSAALASKLIWMNDDILFLRPTRETDLAEPVYLPQNVIELIPRYMQQENKWGVGTAIIAGRLHHEKGIDHLPNFSTHTPYLFHRNHLRKTFEYFGIWFKFPTELAYNGLLGVRGRPCEEKAEMHQIEDPTMRFFNVPDSAVDDAGFRTWLERKYPRPSRWEKH